MMTRDPPSYGAPCPPLRPGNGIKAGHEAWQHQQHGEDGLGCGEQRLHVGGLTEGDAADAEEYGGGQQEIDRPLLDSAGDGSAQDIDDGKYTVDTDGDEDVGQINGFTGILVQRNHLGNGKADGGEDDREADGLHRQQADPAQQTHPLGDSGPP